MNITNKAIIITGASGGIGQETARILAKSGAKLMLTARRENVLQQLQSELTDAGATAIIHTGDVTVEADCRAIVAATVEAFGTVDVLVNNAGYGPPVSLLETTEEIWDATIDSCLKSAYLMTRAAVPHMLENGGGTVVNISSVAGKYGYADRTAYCAAKWGMQGFTEALRDELGGQGIRAYTVNPGAVATPWWGATNDAQPDEIMAKMIQPEEVAEAVDWSLTQPERIQIDEVMLKTFRSPWE
ncbi:MAG: SDR family oxidoreductase [Chloroflexota bacterium]